MDERAVVTLHAKNKAEAISALEMLLEVVKECEYDGWINERVIVTESTMMEAK